MRLWPSGKGDKRLEGRRAFPTLLAATALGNLDKEFFKGSHQVRTSPALSVGRAGVLIREAGQSWIPHSRLSARVGVETGESVQAPYCHT
jgi:hypothetical protein